MGFRGLRGTATRKQGSLDLLICDTIHVLRSADYSLFQSIWNRVVRSVRLPAFVTTYNHNPIRMNSTFVSFASWIGCIVAGHSSAYGQRQRFRLGSFAGLIFLVGIGAFGNDQTPTVAQEKAPALVSAASMLSADTQAMFSLPNSKRFLESWGTTQLGMLAADAKLKDFWDTQRQEIQCNRQKCRKLWQNGCPVHDAKGRRRIQNFGVLLHSLQRSVVGSR